jgi:hypothetical protein
MLCVAPKTSDKGRKRIESNKVVHFLCFAKELQFFDKRFSHFSLSLSLSQRVQQHSRRELSRVWENYTTANKTSLRGMMQLKKINVNVYASCDALNSALVK